LIIPGLAPGRADDHKGFEFEYLQKKTKEYSIEIEIKW
jgi:hypothetical protein